MTGSPFGTLRVWDLITGHATHTLTSLGSAIRAIAISPDDSRMIVSDANGKYTLWDIAAQRPLGDLGAAGMVVSFAFDRDGKRIAAVTQDRFIHIIDTANCKAIGSIYRWHADVYAVAFSPDGIKLVLAFQDDIAEVWDTHTRKWLLGLRGHDGPVLIACFRPDGTRILTASRDATARLWDADSGHELLILRGHTGPVRNATFSPDGTKILTLSDDQTARVWDSVSAEDRAKQYPLGPDTAALR